MLYDLMQKCYTYDAQKHEEVYTEKSKKDVKHLLRQQMTILDSQRIRH